MSTSPSVPESGETYRVEAPGTPPWIIAAVVLLAAGLGYVIYAENSSRKALEADVSRGNQLTEMLKNRLEQTDSRLADLKGQLEVTSKKLGLTEEELAHARSIAQTIRKDQANTEKALAAKIGEVQQQNEAKLGQVATDLTGAKSDIAATRKDLEATKSKMERVMGDQNVMSGLIARNKEEVEDLKRRGERNIFDFDVAKSKGPQKVGPILIRLKKVDNKHSKYTMDVVADDRTIEKKDKNALEPVQFYTRSTHQLYEIVVLETGKDKITGYLSTPKQ
jgi:chromosome segregation ATPase